MVELLGSYIEMGMISCGRTCRILHLMGMISCGRTGRILHCDGDDQLW